MTSANSREEKTRRRIVTAYNQVVNLFWSVLHLAPLGYFCYHFLPSPWLFISLVISLLPAFVPNSLLDSVQLGQTTAVYHRLGIRLVKKYTQDGDFINRLVRKKFPAYAPVGEVPIKKHLGKAYVNEKFHWAAFLFFLLAGLYAATLNYWGWVAVIGVSNLIFNVYPILLQQYNRIRFRRVMKNRTLGINEK